MAPETPQRARLNWLCSLSAGLPVVEELASPKDKQAGGSSKKRKMDIVGGGQKRRRGEEGALEESSVSKTDYIHVRARRGQATDSHSLAERARREKIGERMRYLQDLVPGCNNVTGKASVLDEIINYVQSLQKQVELLSMKLADCNNIQCSYEPLYPPFDPLLPSIPSHGELGAPTNIAELGAHRRPLMCDAFSSEPYYDVCGSSSEWEGSLQELIYKMDFAQRRPQTTMMNSDV